VPNHIPLDLWLVEEEASAFLDDFLDPSIIKDVFILFCCRLGVGDILSFLGKMKGIKLVQGRQVFDFPWV
jgi:hypothetical protein